MASFSKGDVVQWTDLFLTASLRNKKDRTHLKMCGLGPFVVVGDDLTSNRTQVLTLSADGCFSFTAHASQLTHYRGVTRKRRSMEQSLGSATP